MKKQIIKRQSVRSYTGEKLTDYQKLLINDYISNEKNLIGLYGNIIRIILKENEGDFLDKINTYGTTTKSPAFIIVIAQNTKEAMMDVGYVFENFVLYLESIGLNTCWLSGSFDRPRLTENLELEEGEFIPVISPVGKGIIEDDEDEIHKGIKSRNRKKIDDMFFQEEFNSLITDNLIRENLEFLRVAPSGINSQPWRIIFDSNGKANFYIERNPKIAKYNLPFDTQMIDMGIVLSHYVIVSGKNQIINHKPAINIPSTTCEYVISIK
jgi:nitroreductase